MRRRIVAAMILLAGGAAWPPPGLTGDSPGPLTASTQQGTASLEGTARCPAGRPMVVYLESEAAPGGLPPPEDVVVDQRGLVFTPHVLPVMKGTRVGFLNSDPLSHNVFSPSEAKPFNLGSYPPGEIRYVTFDRPGVVEILCNVHLEMSAYVVVLETPYFALVEGGGRYRLDGLPAGRASVSVWCPMRGVQTQTIELHAGSNTASFEAPPGD